MLVAALAMGLGATPGFAAPPKPPPKPPPRPSAPIPALPVITRIHLDVSKDAVVVLEELTIARGDGVAGDVDAFVAFGGPGAPRAFDAHLLASDASGADPADVGALAPSERAARRPATARLLVGRETSAGELVHLREAALRRAFARSGFATVRLRALLGPIEPDAGGFREVLVRLGTFGPTPLSIGRIEIATLDGRPLSAPSEAHLCGDAADPYPMLVQDPIGTAKPVAYPRPTFPELVTRHSTDDLCVRFALGS